MRVTVVIFLYASRTADSFHQKSPAILRKLENVLTCISPFQERTKFQRTPCTRSVITLNRCGGAPMDILMSNNELHDNHHYIPPLQTVPVVPLQSQPAASHSLIPTPFPNQATTVAISLPQAVNEYHLAAILSLILTGFHLI